MLARLARLLAPAIALVLLAATVAGADNEKLAEHLRKLDPGGRVGGTSIVGTEPKQKLHGVHGKPNFIVALGDDETIHGAAKDDELGAIGDGAKIVPSNHGHSLIVAGPHSEIVVAGEGHNLIFSHARGATIILESPGDEVIANGPHDRIVCAQHASHELIEVAKGEKVSKSCRGHHNTIEPLPASSVSARSSAPTAHASVTGDGSNANPYRADCDPGTGFGSGVDCKVSFAPRTLCCFWANEYVPAYECPTFDKWLLNQNYAPAGTALPKGVEVQGLGPIGVSITSRLYTRSGIYYLSSGTATGHTFSSATNWTVGSASYKVILHCTWEYAHGYG
jgi:hypothetical protein